MQSFGDRQECNAKNCPDLGTDMLPALGRFIVFLQVVLLPAYPTPLAFIIVVGLPIQRTNAMGCEYPASVANLAFATAVVFKVLNGHLKQWVDFPCRSIKLSTLKPEGRLDAFVF